MRLDGRQLAFAALIFGSLTLLGAWPSPVTSAAWSQLVSAISNPFLEIDRGTWAELAPVDPTIKRATKDNVLADTNLTIYARGIGGRLQFGLSTRRDSYLPTVIFVALIAAVPFGWRRKLFCLGVGLAVIAAVTIASFYVLVAYSLAHQAPTAYPTSATWRDALGFVFERWLLPPGNRVIAPILLAAGLLASVSANARARPGGSATQRA